MLRKWLPWGVLVLVVVVLLGLFIGRPAHRGQVDACFAEIKRSITELDPDGLVDCVGEGYDFDGHWPVLSDTVLSAERDAANDEFSTPDQLVRKRVLQLVAMYFMQLRRDGDAPQFDYQIISTERRDDGHIEAVVSFQISGQRLRHAPTDVTEHRFTLTSSGWLWPVARIVDHDPFSR